MMATPTSYKRESPFLQRVWKSVFDPFSSVNGDKPGPGDQTPRPQKRRRITGDSLDPTAAVAVAPLFRDPSESGERALRVEVLRIGLREFHHGHDANGLMNGNGSPVKKDNPIIVIRARCRLTILRYVPKVEMRAIYCDSQTCDLKVFRDSDGVCRTARVYLQQPFQVAADKIFVERDDGQGFTLADDYLIQTELESAGDPNWPPFDLLQSQDHRPSASPSRQWVISSRFVYRYSKGRMSNPVDLRKSAGDSVKTDLEMDMDLRWSTISTVGHSMRPSAESTPSMERPLQSQPNGALEPLTNGHINGRAESVVNGHTSHDDQAGMDEEDGDGDAVTPSRSLRMRGKQQTYNLKLLSDKARGKELKERKKRKDAARTADLGQITWLLPAGGRVALENWTCIACFSGHPSFERLKAHIIEHTQFKFTAAHSPRGGWRIAVAPHDQETPQAIRTADFLEPPSPDGGEPEEDSEVELSAEKAAPKSKTKLPAVSFPCSPGGCSRCADVNQKRTASGRPRETKLVIPKTQQPMFDRLSKAILEPGSRVDEPQVNNSWLLQKHRDIIKDYTDVHPDEKEYISEWDAFALAHKATLSPHLHDLYLEFLEEKAAWLASSQNRMNEAMKHFAYLNSRETLNESTMEKALGILRGARKTRSVPPQPASSAQDSETRSSASGCAVCGQPISGPNQLICSNMVRQVVS